MWAVMYLLVWILALGIEGVCLHLATNSGLIETLIVGA